MDKYRYISLKDNRRKENFLESMLLYMLRIKEQEKLLEDNYSLN